jgi:hypothetical protein
MVEQRIGSSLLEINARRVQEAQDIPVQQELRLGDEEREDLSDAATVATLEIAPIHAGDGWRLTVVVEDESSSRDPDEVSVDESIDLETFYSEFVRPGRGTARLVAEVEGPEFVRLNSYWAPSKRIPILTIMARRRAVPPDDQDRLHG